MIIFYIIIGLAYISGGVAYFKYQSYKRKVAETIKYEEQSLLAFQKNLKGFKSDHEWVVCTGCKLVVIRKLKEKLL